MQQKISFAKIRTNSITVPILLAIAQCLIVMAFHENYGYFRDELYYIACSNHLDAGYVDHPPFSIAVLALVRSVFGDSLHAIRFPAAVAGACVVVLAALMVRRLGGGRFAQGLAALAVVAAPVLLSQGRCFSMNAFDLLFWALAIYLVIEILQGDRPRLWLLFGIIMGFGLLNKYSIGFLYIGLFGGLFLTPQRKHFGTVWFWLGVFAATMIFSSHIVWEVQHGFPTSEFMRHASQDKNLHLSVGEFLIGQVRDMNFVNAPLWLLGMYYFFFDRNGAHFRTFGWMYVVVFIVMVAGNAKIYYLSPIYPVLLAGGAVFAERTLAEHSWNWVKPVYAGLLLLGGVIAAPFAIPLLPVDSFIRYQDLLGIAPRADEKNPVGLLPQYYADEFGWEEMVAQVGHVYQTLTPEEQSQCVIFCRNYGEAAAIDFFGKGYGLPPALSGHNNYWLWGPGTRSGSIAIIFGKSGDVQESLSDLRRRYAEVQLVAVTNCMYCMPFENHRPLFLCKQMNTTFQQLWPHERFYI